LTKADEKGGPTSRVEADGFAAVHPGVEQKEAKEACCHLLWLKYQFYEYPG
jgi:hypothetical protein